MDGNHENFDRLYSYPVKEWNGGKVHEIRPSVLHLMRGEVFTIEDKKFFAFGGASSHDIKDGILDPNTEADLIKKWAREFKVFRILGMSWWPQELPSDEEIQNGINNLAQNDNKVDFIITHSPCASTIGVLGQGMYKQDVLTRYLQEIRRNTMFRKWICGHMHCDMNVSAEEMILYDQIIRIN